MKLNRVLMTCLAVFALNFLDLAVHAMDGKILVNYSMQKFKTGVYESTFIFADLKDSPEWLPEKALIPLSPDSAEKLAIEHLESVIGSNLLGTIAGQSSMVMRTSLTQVYRTNHWYYEISLAPIFGAGTGSPPAINVFVRLDGKVIPVQKKVGQKK